MVNEDDIGSKTIGDTYTHVDFPYKCKRCGQYINIKSRFREDHNCKPTEPYEQSPSENYPIKIYPQEQRIEKNNNKKIIGIIILIGILFFIWSKQSLNTCPQINVTISKSPFNEYIKQNQPDGFWMLRKTHSFIFEGPDGYVLNIQNKTYDGWTTQGDATCREASKGGENPYWYYCGLDDADAYIEKINITEKNIDNTNYVEVIEAIQKYVIQNIYDEHQNFVETKCIGGIKKIENKFKKSKT